MSAEANTLPNPFITVDWNLTPHGEWVKTTDDVANLTGITRYRYCLKFNDINYYHLSFTTTFSYTLYGIRTSDGELREHFIATPGTHDVATFTGMVAPTIEAICPTHIVEDDKQASIVQDSSTARAVVRDDDPRIVWKDAVSRKGNKYRIGTLRQDESDAAAVNVTERNGGKPGEGWTPVVHSQTVTWPVGDGTWKTPEQVLIDKLDIPRYDLTTSTSILYSYVLNITNDQNWDYTFWDASDDSYDLNTFVHGDHYVQYGSTDPTIVSVSGIA